MVKQKSMKKNFKKKASNFRQDFSRKKPIKSHQAVTFKKTMGVFFRPIINFKISNHVLFFFLFQGPKSPKIKQD